MSCLIIVDAQVGYSSEIIDLKCSQIAHYIDTTKPDYVIFTQFVNQNSSQFFKTLGYTKFTSEKECAIHPALKEYLTKENCFVKDTYSAFKAKGLLEYLQKCGITSVELCGFETDACILASAFDGFDLGYEISILTELCYSFVFDKKNKTLCKIFERNIVGKSLKFVDETEYLLSTKANREHLLSSIKQAEKGKIVQKTVDELKKN
jgi:nicotinamidase-related amidase